MTGEYSVCGFAVGGDDLVIERFIPLDPDRVKAALTAFNIEDDPGLVLSYPISIEAAQQLTGEDLPPAVSYTQCSLRGGGEQETARLSSTPVTLPGHRNRIASMLLKDFAPHLVHARLGDCDVVGVLDGLVVHFDARAGTIYNSGLTLQDWLDGHVEAWAMTAAEAERVGITDYSAYIERLNEMNPSLLGGAPAP